MGNSPKRCNIITVLRGYLERGANRVDVLKNKKNILIHF
jgi:hypothetical protein